MPDENGWLHGLLCEIFGDRGEVVPDGDGRYTIGLALPIEGRPNRRGRPIGVTVDPAVVKGLDVLDGESYPRVETRIRHLIERRMADYDADGPEAERFRIDIDQSVLDD